MLPPQTFGRHPVPYAVHQHKALRHGVERNEQAEREGHQGLSDRCCWKPDLLQGSATSILLESPSTNRHLRISLRRTKGDPTLSSNIGDSWNKHQVAVDRGRNGSSFFSSAAWRSRGSPNPQMCFARSPALLLYKRFSLKASIRSGPWPKRFITQFLNPRGD